MKSQPARYLHDRSKKDAVCVLTPEKWSHAYGLRHEL